MRVEEVVKKVRIEDIVMADVPIRMVRDKGYAVDKTGPWKAVTVYSREQTFHDFKTKEGGNVVKWLQYFHGMDYDDALRSICGKAAVNPDDLFYFQKLAREAAMPAPKAKPVPPEVKAAAMPAPKAKPVSDYPVTIAWKKWGEEKTYADEFSLLVDCLDRAPSIIWYTRVLVFAKPNILKSLPDTETWPQFEEWKKTIVCDGETNHVVSVNEMVSPVVTRTDNLPKSLTPKVNFQAEQVELFGVPVTQGSYSYE